MLKNDVFGFCLYCRYFEIFSYNYCVAGLMRTVSLRTATTGNIRLISTACGRTATTGSATRPGTVSAGKKEDFLLKKNFLILKILLFSRILIIFRARRFVQHTARHERLDTLCGEEFQGFRGVPCGREDCELNTLHNSSRFIAGLSFYLIIFAIVQ
jgi:hypothetical protein